MGQKFKKDMIGMINSDKDAENRYNTYKYKDPYPGISSALLNSDDLRKYVKTTGMIYPFELSEEKDNNDEWVTYPIKIGDKCYYWDEDGISKCADLKENEEFELKKNSIVFVELEPKFRVPYYIVLRFNLKIKHIYKGLLLGTGPIIDPGFQGKIYIPLHNFTSNNYKFRRGEELIEMEFTKISVKNEWSNRKKNNDKKIHCFHDYIEKALKDNISEKGSLVVKNALPVEIKEQQKKLSFQDKILEEQEEKLKNELEETKKFRNLGLLGGMMAVIAISISIIGIHISESMRYDSLISQTSALEATVKQLEDHKKRINDLESKITVFGEQLREKNGKKVDTQHKEGANNDKK